VTVALPCPLASPPSWAHAALLVTLHVQSRFVVSSSVPVAPPDGTFVEREFSTETWHFTVVGAVTPIDVEVQDRVNKARTAAIPARIGISAAVLSCKIGDVSKKEPSVRIIRRYLRMRAPASLSGVYEITASIGDGGVGKVWSVMRGLESQR
jgi:hypothetical protein